MNVGSGLADLILLPIAQYRKDGRLVLGLQKGARSFVKTTALEAVKMGAKLATGTQVILEGAENILAGTSAVVADSDSPYLDMTGSSSSEDWDGERGPSNYLKSRYADQPQDMKEGMDLAIKSLGKNFNSAAQTILAVPMEVYEGGNEVRLPNAWLSGILI